METNSTDNRSSTTRDRTNDGSSIDMDLLVASAINSSSTTSGNPCQDEINKLYTQTQDILLKAATIQASAAALSVGEEFKVYYDRVVRPTVDIVYFLSFALQNTAATANLYQSNAYGKKGEGKKALDLSYDILEQIEVSMDLVKDSLECLVEKSKCL
ncbi:hypothetical protein [Clostridium sp. B9]|uniref:hypothetical protein n=1 Tax=Clostridium sp. B9 TaxID=3423224 RepID=UPI003D2EFFC9